MVEQRLTSEEYRERRKEIVQAFVRSEADESQRERWSGDFDAWRETVAKSAHVLLRFHEFLERRGFGVTSCVSPSVRLVTTEIHTRADGSALFGSEDSAAFLNERIGSKDREHLVVLHLDGTHRVISYEICAIGSLTATLVHPREVFKSAILANAHSIILGHNHPSGKVQASANDLVTRERMLKVGELLGIPVLDFLVVNGSEFCRVE